MSEPIRTEISKAYPDRIVVKGYSLADMAGRVSFGGMVYLLMTGDLPAGHEGDLIETMLVCCAEHTVNSPSTLAARTVANCGAPVQSAIAAGISAIGEHHGGAGEALARAMQETCRNHPDAGLSAQAAEITDIFHKRGQRVPGLGHRLHNPDPRTLRLVELARQWGMAGHYTALVEEIAGQVAKSSGKALPVNVDGALAALLSDMGVDWRYAKAIFIIARSAGLAAHVIEEMKTGSPFQFNPMREVDYGGPAERPLS